MAPIYDSYTIVILCNLLHSSNFSAFRSHSVLAIIVQDFQQCDEKVKFAFNRALLLGGDSTLVTSVDFSFKTHSYSSSLGLHIRFMLVPSKPPFMPIQLAVAQHKYIIVDMSHPIFNRSKLTN